MKGTIAIICLSVFLFITTCIASWEACAIMFFHGQIETLQTQVEELKNPPLFENNPDSKTFYYNGNITINATDNSIELIFENIKTEK